ncbi:MAG: 3-deoxy-D-manno-octulosonic acid kinase [Gammaproteobacteria bacterium]|nr:3-deoxy-D-manno-octulosonic acid kinase [Gammaproteobacteria bacterium]
MNSIHITKDKCHILYDADYIGQVDDAFFDPEHWSAQHRLLRELPGRGTTVFVKHGDKVLALRHYHRGGMPAKLCRDRYLWLGIERSRPWREWQLLKALYQRGLPVPRPVAARICRDSLSYRGDVVTEVVEGEPLADWLGKKRLPSTLLASLGRCLRRFHDEGVFHADLNARNILLDEAGKVTLIDFDRGELRNPAESWQRANMERLKRSLEKFRRQQRHFAFDDEDWKALLRGYGGAD